MTAQYLFRQVYPLKGGETILYHAAAGGVGLIACQWARALGVTMIGTVSTDEKAAVAKANGCTHTIVTSRENIAERVREITNGMGVPVVYDSIGKDTLEASLDSLQVRGTFVSNGTSSGPVVFNTGRLATKGSLWFTRKARSGSRARPCGITSSPVRTCWTWRASCSTWCLPGTSSASRSRALRWPMRPKRTVRWKAARRSAPPCWCRDRP
jgi:NADPH:quinone reductase-like Zn-dependent oxidoreductase